MMAPALLRQQQTAKRLFVITVLLVPVNLSLLGPIRILDVALLATIVFVGRRELNRGMGDLALLCVLAIVWLLSFVAGTLYRPIVSLDRVFFLYKYMVAFATLWALRRLLPYTGMSRSGMLTTYFWVFAFLSVYVYVHILLVVTGLSSGHIRVSFPFGESGSNDTVSDAPLYSVYLSTSLLGLYLRRRELYPHIPRLVAFAVFVLASAALLFTGSRSGIVSLGLILSLVAARGMVMRLATGRVHRLWLVRMAGVFFAVGLSAAILPKVASVDLEEATRLVSRATNFSFGSDESASGRISKTQSAVRAVAEGPVILGVGAHTMSILWYDSSIGNILVNTGFLGVLIILAILLVAFARLPVHSDIDPPHALNPATIVLAQYAIANLISEFFLVTRSIVSVSLLVAILAFEQKRPVRTGASLSPSGALRWNPT